MLTVEGYASLKTIYHLAKRSIEVRMSRRYRNLRVAWLGSGGDTDGTPVGEEPKRHSTFVFNAEVAAQFLVFDCIRINQGKSRAVPQVISHSGGMFGLPEDFFRPTFRLLDTKGEYARLRDQAISAGLVDRGEIIFGSGTLHSEFWIDLFLFEQIFSPVSMRFIEMYSRPERSISSVDWRNGCVDLAVLKRFLDASEHIGKAADALRSINCEPPARYDRHGACHEAMNLVRILDPLNCRPIVVPEDWLRGMEMLTNEHDERVPGILGSTPREHILSFVDSGEAKSKAEIRARLKDIFPDMSHRQFDRHWAALAAARPALSTPGPKAKNREPLS